MNPLYFNPNYYNKNLFAQPNRPLCNNNNQSSSVLCGINTAGCKKPKCQSCPFNNDNMFNLGYGQCRMIANQNNRCLYGVPSDCPFKRNN